MPVPGSIKPTHKAIKAYYETLAAYADQKVKHEGATETGFQRLLTDTARSHGWMLVPKLTVKRGGKSVIPDGTVRDAYSLHRGYWEAKDSDDDLAAEIRKKIAKGYPLTNIIFEDTQRAVLYQNGQEALKADLTAPQALADLLNAFFSHTEPDIQGFDKAVDEFKESVPDLARALAEILKKSHESHPAFQTAFEKFFTLCQSALNPNIRREAVDEMLIQHLLTERLIRTIFDKDDFTRQNVIAAEVENVIDALTGQAFSRKDFLKKLDRFYVAIELAAANLGDFSEKQHFLNTVYERFFQGYSVKAADTHGIVYTPQEIVDFMCASVAEVLEKEFGKSLGDKEVHILDPCTGTGNFIVNLINRIPKKDLPRMYRQQLFANEVMLLPYYIAALNIEHAYFERTGEYEAFEGLCFVDTLDLVEKQQKTMAFLNEENTQRVERQRKAPITVIIGNPPYNANQVNENDNNKNRAYAFVDSRIRETYARDTSATLKNKLYDPYVKFIRWATDRLNGRDGIVCFVSNNSFAVDQAPFDGMRGQLLRDFTRIMHIDLHGNVRQNPKLSGTSHNVFGIQVGVGITIAVRRKKPKNHVVSFHRVPEFWRRERKLRWLQEAERFGNVRLRKVHPDEDNNWVILDNAATFARLLPTGSENGETVFDKFSTGAKSNRDNVVYDFRAAACLTRIEAFVESYNSELDRYKRKNKPQDIDSFVDYAKLKWSSTLKLHLQRGKHAEFDPKRIRTSLYRPFVKKWLYYDELLLDRPGLFRRVLPTEKQERENVVIYSTNHSQIPFSVLATNCIANEAVGGRAGTCFPFYTYDEVGGHRRENITDWALNEFRKHYKDKTISKWDIFYYAYGILHHPSYREKFADNLKRELPRIPFARKFKAFSKAGQQLVAFHVGYEKLDPTELNRIDSPDLPLSYRVERMKLAKDKMSLRVNESLTLAGIPPEAFEYRLGNRSALEWVIDQYQVSEDKRSGIKSDPNRADDPEYIVRLVGQVVRVSVETVQIVKKLPAFE